MTTNGQMCCWNRAFSNFNLTLNLTMKDTLITVPLQLNNAKCDDQPNAFHSRISLFSIPSPSAVVFEAWRFLFVIDRRGEGPRYKRDLSCQLLPGRQSHSAVEVTTPLFR